MYTLLYLKWITNKDLLQSTWKSVQCYVAARMEGDFGREFCGGFQLLRHVRLCNPHGDEHMSG